MFPWPHSQKFHNQYVSPQSQETERQSGKTGPLHRNPFGILKFTEQPKTSGINTKKIASSKGDQLLKGVFHAIMDKIEAGILQIAKKWNWK